MFSLQKVIFRIQMSLRHTLVLLALRNLNSNTSKSNFLNILCIFTHTMYICGYIQHIHIIYLAVPIDPFLEWLSLTLGEF